VGALADEGQGACHLPDPETMKRKSSKRELIALRADKRYIRRDEEGRIKRK
jgi:hypothetical protein